VASDKVATLHNPELILLAEFCDQAGSSAAEVVGGEVSLGKYDELNMELIRSLLYIF